MTTNGTTAQVTDEGSLLDRIDADFQKNFKGKTTKKRTDELVKAYLNSTKARAAAEAAVLTAIKTESDAVVALIREGCGKAKVKLPDGNTYSPMSRGERVFFRKESANAIELG